VNRILRTTGLSSAFIAIMACSQNAADGTNGLAGTSWQLVQFEGGDGRVLKPADPTRYTIAFARDGRVSARVDCNRGMSTWQSPERSALTLGPLGLTKMYCGPNELNDKLARDWEYVRTYTLRNGRLYLSLMADAGIYEFLRAR
jgi:para-nitrobenzyl esterase